MTIRWRIWLFVAIAGLIGLASTAVVGFAAWQDQRLVNRLENGQRRLEVVTEIDGNANHYGEQVASALLTGRDDLSELQAARLELERNFARLSQVTKAEIERLAGGGGVDDELRSLENTRRMTDLYHAIDRATARALILLRDGKPSEATELFRTEVAFRLSNELQPLIDTETKDDRDGLTTRLAQMAELRWMAALAAGGLAIGSIGISTWFGLRLVAAVRRQAGEAARREVAASAGLLETAAQLSSGETRHTQFLADVSHELRTPLTILRGEADVALRRDLDQAELRLALERIQGQAEELGELLEDMISFARADADDTQFLPSPVRAADVVLAAAEEGETLAEPREVTIATELTDDRALIEADQRRLKRALLIGIDNAIKHSPPGGRVTVVTAIEGSDVAIRILDDGPGVPDDEKAHVFERFFRGRAEKELQNRGIGIGLPIARDIVNHHRGRIALDNRPEGGAVLTIALPRVEDALP